MTIRADLDLSLLNLDGTQSLAKKCGEKVAYQGRKKGVITNILPITDRNGYVIACTDYSIQSSLRRLPTLATQSASQGMVG